MSLRAKWSHLQEECEAIEQSTLSTADSHLQDRIREVIEELRALWQLVESAGTHSRNEELDDVHTEDLQYLRIPFFECELLARVVADRCTHLRACRSRLLQFQGKCHNLGVLPEKEFEALTEASTDRESRVARHKKEKELRSALAATKAARDAAAARRATVKDDEEGEDDWLERRYQLLLLELALRQSFASYAMCLQELQLLELSEAAKEDACAARDAAQAEARRAPADPIRLEPAAPTERQRILAEVFQPRNEPTMSLEQYMALHPEEFQPAPAAQSTVEEDPDKEGDEAVEKQRAWDDWKDDHPKGWGNRLGNRG